MSIVVNTFSAYFNWFVSCYRAISKINSMSPSLKLVTIEEKDFHEPKFIVQISGKNLFPKFTLSELIEDVSILRLFNVADQQKISHYLPKDFYPITYKIIARTFDREIKKTIFTLEYVDNKVKKQIRTSDVFRLSRHVNFFDREDAFLIGLEVSRQF